MRPLLSLLTRWIVTVGLLLVFTAPGHCAGGLTTTTGVLGKGQSWETSWYEIQAPVDGPTLLIVGGMHGNEPAGAAAAEQIRHWPLARGRLLVIPRAAVLALRAEQRTLPEESTDLRDLNRDFPAIGADDDHARGEIAEAIWSFVRAEKPDWVLDLHEGYEFNGSHNPPPGEKKSVGSSVIFIAANGHAPFVERMLNEVNATIADPNHRFVPLGRGPVDSSLVRACIEHLGARGMILETTFKDQALSTRTRQHRILVDQIMRQLGMVERECVDILAPSVHDGNIVVGLFDGDGSSANGQRNLDRLFESDPQVVARHLGPADISPDVLQQFDVLVFPGGSGSKQAAALGESGRTTVREYVQGGGKYVGICAGAYLCSAHYSWSLNLIDTRVLSGTYQAPGGETKQMWYRGEMTTQDVQLTESGRTIFADVPQDLRIRYQNGPIVSRAGNPDLEPYDVLAYFRSEQVRHPPQAGTMIDTPAIVTAPYGAGRVLSISPHPEATDGLQPMLLTALRSLVASP